MIDNTDEKKDDFSPRIERDGGAIKLISNENTYIIIDKDQITLRGNIIIDGNLDVKTGASGATAGTSISLIKNGTTTGNW